MLKFRKLEKINTINCQPDYKFEPYETTCRTAVRMSKLDQKFVKKRLEK